MADRIIYDGGTRNSSATFEQYPSVNTSGVPPQSYADHQRAKIFDVRKVIDLRPMQNWGTAGNKDVALPYYMKNNSITFAVADTIQTNLIVPQTVLERVGYQVYADGVLAGATFRLYLASVGSGTTFFTGISTAAAGYNVTYSALSMPRLFTAQDTITLEFQTAAAALTYNCGLHMAVFMRVSTLDNGNA